MWANSADFDDKLMMFFFFFPENRTGCLMKFQILIFGEYKKNILMCHLLKILPRVLNVKFGRNRVKCLAQFM